ncbi:MAG: peptidase, partial [Mesorhizobium sp.]
AGYRIIREGECRGGGGGGEEQTFCTREYRPVCARRHCELRTFPNECEARAADYRVVDDGPC